MKHLLSFTLLVVFALPAFARTTTVTGYGRENGYCNGAQSFSCVRTIEDRAKRDGIRDAEWRCQSNGGQSRTYSAFCSTSCYPNYIPPRETSVAVQCTANCSMQCEL